MRLSQETLSIDGEQLVCDAAIKSRNAIILHGAGQSDRKRFYPIAEELLRRDIGVVLFDFSSHGNSTGHRHELSLNRRRIQAEAVIKQITPDASKLYLIGFSMSGQTVCDLLPFYGDRVTSILLGCPAIYAREAYTLPFQSDAFTRTLRGDKTWRHSTALESLKSFTGKTTIAIGDQDDVIPSDVITALRSAAQHPTYIEYPDVSHQLAVWLGRHPTELKELIDRLVTP